jgi:hypothetical protein
MLSSVHYITADDSQLRENLCAGAERPDVPAHDVPHYRGDVNLGDLLCAAKSARRLPIRCAVPL